MASLFRIRSIEGMYTQLWINLSGKSRPPSDSDSHTARKLPYIAPCSPEEHTLSDLFSTLEPLAQELMKRKV